jgi:hypothetical protein
MSKKRLKIYSMRHEKKRLSGKNPDNHDSVSRLLCHVISIAITAVIALFAAEGGTHVWPTHPRSAPVLALLCAAAAGIGLVRFCAQFGVKRPTQSRILLALVIAIFAAVSVTLGAIAEYRGARNIESTLLVCAFFGDFVRGSLEAVVPFCIGCFLEILPLAALLLLVRGRPKGGGSRTESRAKPKQSVGVRNRISDSSTALVPPTDRSEPQNAILTSSPAREFVERV